MGICLVGWFVGRGEREDFLKGVVGLRVSWMFENIEWERDLVLFILFGFRSEFVRRRF